jgi:hypothetical protein
MEIELIGDSGIQKILMTIQNIIVKDILIQLKF